jgi:hypothetical protein
VADEILKSDQNHRRVVAGIANDASQDILMLRLDPVTKRLLVDIGSGGSSGTQYTEGDTDASITGTAIMWEDAGDTLRAVSVAKPLPIQPGTSITFPVTDNGGSLTVDAPVGTPVFVRLSDGSSAIATLPVSLASVPSHAVTNAGTFAVQVDGNALTALQLIDDPVLADDAAFTPATSKVMMAGFQADESSTDSVDEGDAGAARMTLDRKLIATIQPHTAGGWDTFMASSGDGSTALTNSAQAVKASAGKLGGWYIYNPNSSATYVIIYNVASGSVTVGTTNPKLVLCIPATSAANLELVNGITFDTAISVAATTTGGGNSAPSSALEANFFYK